MCAAPPFVYPRSGSSNGTGTAYGEPGDDLFVAAAETDDGLADACGGTADGGSGDDTLIGNCDGDKLFGGSGGDFLNAGNSNHQSLDCGSAYDTYNAIGPDSPVLRCEGNVGN
jgi:hypothetical protein